MRMGVISFAASPLNEVRSQPFLVVKADDWVIVKSQHWVPQQHDDDWWMGQVVGQEGEGQGAAGSAMFQVTSIDDGSVFWVHSQEVVHIVRSLDGLLPGDQGWTGLA